MPSKVGYISIIGTTNSSKYDESTSLEYILANHMFLESITITSFKQEQQKHIYPSQNH